MKFVAQSRIEGAVAVPPSKSAMQRALTISMLASGTTKISNPSFCDDSVAAIRACKALGAKIKEKADCVEVEGVGFGCNGKKGKIIFSGKIDCSESGLCARMFTPIVCLSGGEFTIAGKGSLLSRPMAMVEKPLSSLGAEVKSSNGKLPLQVKGPLVGGQVEIDGSVSSQFLTGLLIALPLCKGDSVVRVNGLKSRGYVELTVQVVSEFGVKIRFNGCESFEVKGCQTYKACDFTVEGDWSCASFLLAAGAVAGKVNVKGLNMNSLQPDKAILKALELAGAKISIGHDNVIVEKSNLHGFEFDASDCPDLFPPLVALACNCSGPSIINGVDRLEHKESDRANVLVQEFSGIGVKIKIEGNSIEVAGEGSRPKIRGGTVDSHGDHRIVMAAAVAGIASKKGVSINNESCVSKSYPEFFEVLDRLRVVVQ